MKQILLSLLFICGCHQTFKVKTIQMNPVYYLGNPEILNISQKLPIIRGNMSIGHFKMVSYANFVIISRDRIRFNVELTNVWRDLSRVCEWESKVYIDDVEYVPECDKGGIKMYTKTWDQEHRRVKRNHFGEIVYVEPYERNPTPLDTITIHVGKGYLNFYKRDMLTKTTKKIALKLRKKNVTYWFVWKLVKPEE